MKIALLAGASSIHAIRWANGLAEAGHRVLLISQHTPLDPLDERVKHADFPNRGSAGYFLMVPAVRRLLREFAPDVTSAHYASGYATTARLAGCRPWLLSVWGSDVFDFPGRSPLHRWWVRRNLEAADRVASTSHCMADRVRQLAPRVRDIAITPFGVDTAAFRDAARRGSPRSGEAGTLVVGTVKVLAPKYGVDTLIRAYAMLRTRLGRTDTGEAAGLRLRIVGDGPSRRELEELARALGVADTTEFTGWVPHRTVPREVAGMDVFVALSRLESFGVAIVEAGAARRPVVVSNAGGLPEVVRDGETGRVVPCDNPEAAAAALEELVRDAGLRVRMGEAAAAHVARAYDWRTSVRTMEAVLREMKDCTVYGPGRP